MPEIRPLSPFPATKTSFSKPNRRTFVCLLRALCRAHMVSARKHNDLPRHCSRNFNEKHLRIPLSKSCFVTENQIFLCPENVPQKCKWLQCVRLVINKRRSPTGDAAAPHRRPRASRSGADQAHTLPQTNQPLNRLLSLCKTTNAGNTLARRKARRGAEPSPLIRSGSATAFPRRVRVFHYTFA